jgi:hypothetical protein
LDDVDLEVSKYLEYGASDAGQFPHNTVHYAKRRAEAAGDQSALARLDEYGTDARTGYEKNLGTTYELDIPDDDTAKFLDWDAPIEDQPDIIQDALLGMRDRAEEIIAELKSLDEGYPEFVVGATDNELFQMNKRRAVLRKELNEQLVPESSYQSGGEFYRAMSSERLPTSGGEFGQPGSYPRGKPSTSEALRQAGIPGLRYFDQMSRNPAGAGVTDTVSRVLQAVGGDVKRAIAELKNRQKYGNMAPGDPRSNVAAAIKHLEELGDPRTSNFVVWDQDVLDRTKILGQE